MKKNKPIVDKKTLVTVTCTRDKWFMALQAFSIDKFVEDPCIHYVLIEDDETPVSEWKKILAPFYTRHRLMLITKDVAPTLYPKCGYQENMQGWQRQQILKLSIANLVNTLNYLNLDSKDIFIKPCTASSIIKEGNDKMFFYQNTLLSEGFKTWIETVSEYTGIPIPETFWLFESPFLFKTKTVKTILKTIDIEDLFLQVHNWQSEYLLYRFFSKEPLPNRAPYVERFMTPEDYGSLKNLTKKYKKEHVIIFTLHRKSFASNTDVISNFLLSKGFDKYLVDNAVSTAAFWHQ